MPKFALFTLLLVACSPAPEEVVDAGKPDSGVDAGPTCKQACAGKACGVDDGCGGKCASGSGCDYTECSTHGCGCGAANCKPTCTSMTCAQPNCPCSACGTAANNNCRQLCALTETECCKTYMDKYPKDTCTILP